MNYSNMNPEKGSISSNQIDFIVSLGGTPTPDMSSQEASGYIDELLAQKKANMKANISDTECLSF